MPSLATALAAASARGRLARRLSALLVTSFVAVTPARGQTTLSHTDDAAPVPAGMLRLRLTNAWTRFDERFTSSGLSPLGADFSADSLGPRQLPRLAPIEQGIKTLSANPAFRLSLGRLEVLSNARIVTTPIALEYGVTRRLSVGIVVPIVQTRRVARARMITPTTPTWVGNVVAVPEGQRTTAGVTNRSVADAFTRAADSLGALITRCQQNPAGAGCAPVNANAADAAAARAQAQSFAAAVRTLGTDSATALLAPRSISDVAFAIDAARLALNQRLQQYLGSGFGSTSGVYTARTPFSYIDLQGRFGAPGLLQGPLGGGLDSIHTTERIGFGDIAVGAQYLLLDRFQRDSLPLRGIQTRVSIGGALRFATSRPDSARTLLDIATGDGPGAEFRTALDVILGHFGSTIAGRYVKSFSRTVQAPLFGDPEAPWPYPLFGNRTRTAGDVLGVDVTPRLLLGESMSIDGSYGIERIGPTRYDDVAIASLIDPCTGCVLPPVVTVSGGTRTAQRLGLGLRYSTVDAFLRHRAAYPLEVSFTHLTTITGDVGLPRLSREQIQVRLFYRLFRR
jgi:hypothetical protein